MKKLVWLLCMIVLSVATWGAMNRVSEWERVARFEAAVPHVYKVVGWRSMGSGWAWDHDTIITNAHVVESFVPGQVTIHQGSRRWTVTKITILKNVDAAMVDVKGVPLHAPARTPRPYLRPGRYVLVAGYPMDEGPMITEGYISGPMVKGRYWTDAPVNPGGSGGPIFNSSGEIIGMMAGGTPERGHVMGLLIPLQRIINGMERPEFRTTDPVVGGE